MKVVRLVWQPSLAELWEQLARLLHKDTAACEASDGGYVRSEHGAKLELHCSVTLKISNGKQVENGDSGRWSHTLTVTKEDGTNADTPLMPLAGLSSWCVLAGIN